MGFNIFIPARYDSQRLPGKVLLKLNNKTILEHSYECAIKANPDRIIIATDHEEVAEHAQKMNAEVVMTSKECPNGTARISQALQNINNQLNFADDDIIVNLQADEVVMPPNYIKKVATDLSDNTTASIATLSKPISTKEDLLNPNIVKVVKNQNGMAMYFSRAPIAYIRDGFEPNNLQKYKHWHHIGLYAYRVSFLKEYNNLKATEIEHCESLEQLRALWHGYNIHVGEVVSLPTCEINTKEDLDFAKLIMED